MQLVSYQSKPLIATVSLACMQVTTLWLKQLTFFCRASSERRYCKYMSDICYENHDCDCLTMKEFCQMADFLPDNLYFYLRKCGSLKLACLPLVRIGSFVQPYHLNPQPPIFAVSNSTNPMFIGCRVQY